jgi:hypothetical protein
MSWDPRRLLEREPLPRAVALAALVLFVAVTLFVALHHEAWRDEADSWLRVRDGDFHTLVVRGRYTGFPLLWYALLAPLPRLGLPYVSQALLNLLIAAGGVALLLRLPLSWTTRVLAAFSYFFAYEYAVIARPYALAILLAFAAAAMHRQRDARPYAYAAVVALLFNVNAEGFAIAGALAALFILERRRPLGAAAIMIAAAVLSWLQVRTPPDPARVGRLHGLDLTAVASSIGDAFFPTVPFGVVGGVAILVLITLALRRSRAALFVFWLPFAALTLLHAYIWYGGLRHAGFVLVLALLAIAVADDAAPRPAAAAALLLNLSLLVSVAVAARFWVLDTHFAFSGGKEMAEAIRAGGLDRFEIAAHNAPQCEAVLPYLPGKKFWYAGIEEDGSFLEWDAKYERGLDVWYDVAEGRARRHFAGKPWLLLLSIEMPDPAGRGFRLLYTNRRPIFGKREERFWLYAPLR